MKKKKSLGVLLVNLGSPAQPKPQAIRRFLRELLSDPRVVGLPRILWLPILYGFILPWRPIRIAKKYRAIWKDSCSPLIAHSQSLLSALQDTFQHEADRLVIDLAMTYSKPSLDEAIKRLLGECDAILVFPMFPQYASSTTGAIFRALFLRMQHVRALPKLIFVEQYYRTPVYIKALADSIRSSWVQRSQDTQKNILVLSFHGIPLRSKELGDPYYSQCMETGALLVEELKLSQGQYRICFQSRFGPSPWLQPYTEDILYDLAQAREGGRYYLPRICCRLPRNLRRDSYRG